METDSSNLDLFMDNPAEGLKVECKNWIDPDEEHGKLKLVRAAISLRNNDGGTIIFGIDDKTRRPDPNPPYDVTEKFHTDKIQYLISRYASDTFEVTINFISRNDVLYPVVKVPSGVKTPVALKKEIGKYQIGTILFRTLNASGVVSTAPARPTDWASVIQICMDNRDADIARFIRRHLSDIDFAKVFSSLPVSQTIVPATLTSNGTKTPETLRAEVTSLLERGRKRFTASYEPETAPPYDLSCGNFEVALKILPPLMDRLADQKMRKTILAADPHYSSMVLWHEINPRPGYPHTVDGGWETLSLGEGAFYYLDFMRMEPDGGIYQQRLHSLDMWAPRVPNKLGSALDPTWIAQDVGEAMAVGLAFATALGADKAASLGFLFVWSGLTGRSLVRLAADRPILFNQMKAVTDKKEAFVEMPLNIAVTSIAPFVMKAVNPLLAEFNGYSMDEKDIETHVRKRLEGKA